MREAEVIQKRIECERIELYRMEKKHGGFVHPKVIKQSMRLDELINMYNRAMYSCSK
ncbi:aspartyl-phosphate phosphatase Spo0E family protein [Paenibacillus anaericanus]|uniref:Aspartyl-phosphate phosphatase Spo0E family protein n=1 Tax=Paenibacillus anaericanus TaxID=170367 RepID=A0A433Y4S5_9BACL|nr:aspartyl-phosphate phosphatase Spo0E family protein [Paenibacillus anaericanus]RUT43297.1 aspartyl-phosphate phosphatase Spo0E family protein [Paenibacillus anaericanus]